MALLVVASCTPENPSEGEGEKVCGVDECSDGIIVDLPGFSFGNFYLVIIETDVGDANFRCQRGAGGELEVENYTGDLAALTPECRATSLLLTGEDLAGPLRVQITNNSNDLRAENFPAVVYEQFRPNGAECDPECRVANFSIE